MAVFGRKKKEENSGRAAPAPQPASDELLNYIIVILDSCRYDTFMEASPRTILKLGKLNPAIPTRPGPPPHTTTCSWVSCPT